MGDKAIDIKAKTKGKKKVPAKAFLTRLIDLKKTYKNQIPWGTLYRELSKNHQVMEFAWKDSKVILFLSTVHNNKLNSYFILNTISQSH